MTMVRDTGGEVVFEGDPYVQPGNVHIQDDGTRVYYGPHGSEFTLTTDDEAKLATIESGEAPTYDQYVADLYKQRLQSNPDSESDFIPT